MQTMIKYKGGKDLSAAINRARETAEASFPAGDLRIVIDRDPYVLL